MVHVLHSIMALKCQLFWLSLCFLILFAALECRFYRPSLTAKHNSHNARIYSIDLLLFFHFDAPELLYRAVWRRYCKWRHEIIIHYQCVRNGFGHWEVHCRFGSRPSVWPENTASMTTFLFNSRMIKNGLDLMDPSFTVQGFLEGWVDHGLTSDFRMRRSTPLAATLLLWVPVTAGPLQRYFNF